jgi:hypothetical protein
VVLAVVKTRKEEGMSTHIDALRDIAANHGWPVCDEAANEIEQLEQEVAELKEAYALLFKENALLRNAGVGAPSIEKKGGA